MEVASWFRAAWMLPALGSSIHEGKREPQHELWHSEAKNDGSFPTRQWPQAHFQEAEGKGVALAKMSPELNLLKRLRDILK